MDWAVSFLLMATYRLSTSVPRGRLRYENTLMAAAKSRWFLAMT